VVLSLDLRMTDGLVLLAGIAHRLANPTFSYVCSIGPIAEALLDNCIPPRRSSLRRRRATAS